MATLAWRSFFAAAIVVALFSTPAFAQEAKSATNAEAIIAKAKAALHSGKREAAAKILIEAIANYEIKLKAAPKDAAIAYELAQLQYELQRDDEAAKSIETALSLQPNEPEFHWFKGRMLMYGNEREGAEKEFRKAIELNPKVAKYSLDLSRYLWALFRRDEAIALSRRAVESNPNDLDSAILLAGQSMETGKQDEGIKVLQAAIVRHPKNADLRDSLGQVLQIAGKNSEAYEQFARLAEIDPTSVHAESRLLQLATSLKKNEEAAKHLARVHKLFKEGHAKEPMFRREQFKVGNNPVIAFEYFELKGPQALKYRFDVLDEKGVGTAYRVSLGSYDLTTDISRQTGSIKADERMYHLDYYRGREHRTFGFFPAKPPSYEETRAAFLEIAAGTKKAISGSTQPGR